MCTFLCERCVLTVPPIIRTRTVGLGPGPAAFEGPTRFASASTLVQMDQTSKIWTLFTIVNFRSEFQAKARKQAVRRCFISAFQVLVQI